MYMLFCFLMIRRPPRSTRTDTLFPYTTIFRSTGALVPLGTLVEVKDVSGPNLVQRYNMYVSVPVQGNAAPGVSTGDALDIMEGLARDVLPPGTDFEWTELAYQERNTGNTAIFIFGLSEIGRAHV